MHLLTKSTKNQTQGIKSMDWEVHLTTNSRHQSNVQKYSATMIVESTNIGVEGEKGSQD